MVWSEVRRARLAKGLYRPHQRDALTLDHVDDPVSHARYRLDGLGDQRLLALSSPQRVSQYNAHVGAVVNCFVRWMHQEGLPERFMG